MFFSEPKTLIVVYKNELLVNQLKKLVETNDDIDDESVVGVRDGSVRIVSWTETVWNDQKKAGNINNKVLFLGEFKDVKAIAPIMEVKYNKYGIKYGWAGNQALIVADPTALSDRVVYQEFIESIKQYDLPESLKPSDRIKQGQTLSADNQDAIPESDEPEIPKEKVQKQKIKNGFVSAIGKTIGFVSKTASSISTGVSHAVSQIGSAIDDLPADRNLLKTQQYYLGIMKLYENHLEEFIQK